MITRGHCNRFIGQHVVFRTTDGVTHHGVLQSVGNDGIYIRPVGGNSTRLANATDVGSDSLSLLQDTGQTLDDTSEAWFPFFFFPFFALWWLYPWAWW